MKWLIFYLNFMCCVFCSCSSRSGKSTTSFNYHHAKIVGLTQRNVLLDSIQRDMSFIVIVDTMVNETIFYYCEELVCEEFDSLLHEIHRGKYAEVNNCTAIAFARANNNQIKANFLLNHIKECEKNGLKAQKEIIKHLDTCSFCKLLKYDICPSCNNNHFLNGLQCSKCGIIWDEEYYWKCIDKFRTNLNKILKKEE